MNLAQIVVYRSPLDQWIWESGLGWGLIYTALVIVLLMVAGFGLAIAWDWAKDQWHAWKMRGKP